MVCGVRVEEVEEPLMREIRYLDKLIDELAKGKAMEQNTKESLRKLFPSSASELDRRHGQSVEKPEKKSVNLATSASTVSRIRRDPPPKVKEKEVDLDRGPLLRRDHWGNPLSLRWRFS